MHGRRGPIIRRLHAEAFAQCIAQGHGTPMFLEQITEGFLGKVLQVLAGLKAELVERVPGLAIEFDAAADGLMIHGTAKSA